MPDMKSKKEKVKKLIFPDAKAKPDPMAEKVKISPQAAEKIRKKASVILGAGTEY